MYICTYMYYDRVLSPTYIARNTHKESPSIVILAGDLSFAC